MDPRTRELRQIKGLYRELMTRIVKLEGRVKDLENPVVPVVVKVKKKAKKSTKPAVKA